MFRDRFDKACWLLLASVLVALVLVVVTDRGAGQGKGSAAAGKALEREMAYRARVELINKLFAPVEELRIQGKGQEALLKLDELIRKYPGEAHGHILQGQILREMGAQNEAVASFVSGIKLNGDYLDARSPLCRRDEIQKLVAEQHKRVIAQAAANPGNRSLTDQLQKINYLRSRLAGGCE